MSAHHPFVRLSTALLVFVLTISLFAFRLPVQAAEPGAEIINFSGSVGTTTTRTLALTETGPTNMSLAVSGGTATDSITLTLLTVADVTLTAWSARSGETIWATADLPAGGKLRLTTLATSLDFTLQAYARGTVLAPTVAAASLAGVIIGAGDATGSSAVQLAVPTAGLYRLALGASSGAFQLIVDDNYLRKTVVSGQAPTAEDSTYYFAAGNHTFTISASKTEQTAWSLGITQFGTIDNLPYTEVANVVGGAFTEEWIPIQVVAGIEVNLSVAVSGSPTDKLTVELYNGTTLASFAPALVAGQETIWGTSQLAAGVNHLHIVTQGTNSSSLSYSITLSAIGSPEVTLTGASQGSSLVNSTARVNFPSNGLYRFTLAANAGRYQLRLGDNYLRRIVAGADSFTAFVPAGVQTLVVDQDSALGTTWSVGITAVEQTADTLPFTRTGQTLTSTVGDFAEEWLPIALTTGGPVNIRLVATDGNETDALTFEIAQPGATASFMLSAIFQGESTWATTSLQAGTSLLRVSAASSNTRPMSYTLEIWPVQAVPVAFAGSAHNEGLDPTFTFSAPDDGIYTFTLNLANGAGQIVVDKTQTSVAGAAVLAAGTVLTQRVQLKAGLHTLTFERDVTQLVTDWAVTTGLVRATPPLSLTSGLNFAVPLGTVAELILTGTGFASETTVTLLDANGTAVPITAVVLSSTQIRLNIPANTALGSYTLRLSNPAGELVERVGVVTIIKNTVYLPLIVR